MGREDEEIVIIDSCELKRGHGLFLGEMVFSLGLRCAVFWGLGIRRFGFKSWVPCLGFVGKLF